MQKIGIFGGTFNPPHNAHLAIADVFFKEARLNKLLFIPAFLSPFKIGETNSQSIEKSHRLNMLKLAISNTDYIIDDYELNKKGISYSYETINYLRHKYTDAELFMLIGGDQARNFLNWKYPEVILKSVQLCIAARSGSLTVEDKILINNSLSVPGHNPVWLNSPVLDISSTSIRNKIKNGEDVSPFLPNNVYNYIINHKLYFNA